MGVTSVTWSRFRTYQRCPKRYQYRFVQNLQLKVKPQALQKGYWIHEALQDYYVTGHWQSTLDKMMRTLKGLFEEERDYYGELLPEIDRLMDGYHRHWGGDLQWKVLSVEEPFEIEMKGLPPIRGRLDLKVRWNKGIWIVEHKSRKRLSPDPPLIPDPQSLIYLGGLIIGGEKVQGYIRNFIRTKAPTIPRLLKKGGLPKRIDTDEFTLRRAIKEHNLNPADYAVSLDRARLNPYFTRFAIPIEAEAIRETYRDLRQMVRELEAAKRYRRNICNECRWDCDYLDLCMMDLRGLDTSVLRRKMFIRG